jgi:hypothetical protein
MAAVGVPMRTVQEWMGHADFKTTLIYADYSPDERRDRDLVARAFEAPGSNLGSNLSETESNSETPNRSGMRGGSMSRTASLGLWSRWSPVRVRSLTPHEAPANAGVSRITYAIRIALWVPSGYQSDRGRAENGRQ